MDLMGIAGLIIGIGGIFYAWLENRKRKRVEDVLEENIDALEKSVLLQGRRGAWAKENINKLLSIVGVIPDEEKRAEAIKAAGYGRGDATSAEDLSVAIYGHLQALRSKKKISVFLWVKKKLGSLD